LVLWRNIFFIAQSNRTNFFAIIDKFRHKNMAKIGLFQLLPHCPLVQSLHPSSPPKSSIKPALVSVCDAKRAVGQYLTGATWADQRRGHHLQLGWPKVFLLADQKRSSHSLKW